MRSSHRASSPKAKHFKHVEAAARVSLTPNPTQSEHFPNDFYVSGDILFCKFCPWVTYDDHWLLQTRVRNTVLHALSKGAIRIEGNKRILMEKKNGI